MNNFNGFSNYETWAFVTYYKEQLMEELHNQKPMRPVLLVDKFLDDLASELDGSNQDFLTDVSMRSIQLVNVDQVVNNITENI